MHFFQVTATRTDYINVLAASAFEAGEMVRKNNPAYRIDAVIRDGHDGSECAACRAIADGLAAHSTHPNNPLPPPSPPAGHPTGGTHAPLLQQVA